MACIYSSSVSSVFTKLNFPSQFNNKPRFFCSLGGDVAGPKAVNTTEPLLLDAARGKGKDVERPPVWLMRQAGRYRKKKVKKVVGDDGDVDEDAFEALFRQLEDDLKKDELLGNDGGDDDITEEDLAKLEQELAEALEDDDLLVALGSLMGGVMNDDNDEEEGDEEEGGKGDVDIDIVNNDEDGDEVDEEEEMPVKLKSWQLRRLAYALKDGRRKTSIKNLAADICLDRAVVLKLLRDPPPNLVMLSATLPDKPTAPILSPVAKVVEDVPLETTTVPKPEVEVKGPIHVMQNNWSARKRLKKVQVETLEQVYRRSKRPTNAMISSIVHVTNLPRKRVVKWFEDKRAEDGVPKQRLPHEPQAAESASAV